MSAGVEKARKVRWSRVKLANPSDHLAFQIRLAIQGKNDEAEILPVLWDDNYIELMPGESREITAQFLAPDSLNGDSQLSVTGWNIEPGLIPAPGYSANNRLIRARTDGHKRPAQPAHLVARCGLNRSLGLWQLIIIGIVIVQPIAPMGIYGVISNEARGHVVTTILIAMVAMLFTAVSYGKMARAYPSAGSAYTYVGREIHPALGYVTGWAMVMDYILNPLICTVICSKLTQNILPGVPYWALAIGFAGIFTVLNLRAIQTSARINEALAAGMMIVVVIFFAFVIRSLWGLHEYGAGFFTQPFYNPQTFSFRRRVPRHFHRRAHLHRLRRHLDVF